MLKKLILSVLAWPNLLWAYGYSSGLTIGEVARNILEPTSFLTKAIYAMCYVIGSSLILGSLMMYKMHRDNPIQTPMSRVIFLFLFGVVIVLIPIVAQLSEGASTVSGT